MADLTALAPAYYRAYVADDRAAIEAWITDDFRFTSPLDNQVTRETYFARCWPNGGRVTGFRFVHLVQDGERVFVTYEGKSSAGHDFRNTEILTFRGDRLAEVEVYFGWSLPHEAAPGGFVDK